MSGVVCSLGWEGNEQQVEEGSKGLVEETIREHDQCMWVVAEVEACLEQHPDKEGLWVAELLEKLSRLDVALRQHFQVEEKGPLYRQLPIKHPRLASRASALRPSTARSSSGSRRSWPAPTTCARPSPTSSTS